jgi:hypothetical protein
MRSISSNIFILIVITLVVLAGCKKYADQPGARTDPRFDRLYCNVPEAVNYNWNFPGTPDSTGTVCFYPSDVFRGSFLYTDSIYNGLNVFVRQETKTLSIVALTRTDIGILGFCPALSLPFTANRNLRADADSTMPTGQLLCRNKDTLSGYIYRVIDDTMHIQFALRVSSDTGVYFHRGSALKQ